MQTRKIIVPFIALMFAVTSNAQQPVFISTTNDLRLPEKEFSFQVSVTRDATAPVFSLMIKNPEKKRLWIQVTHRILGVAVDTTINTEQFACRYNLTEADEGHYIISVRNGKEKFSKEIEVN